MIKVALVNPPQLKSQARGVGFYAGRLLAALQRLEGLSARLVDYAYISPALANFDLVHYPFFDLFYPTFPPSNSQGQWSQSMTSSL
jgi:hypothetical protein